MRRGPYTLLPWLPPPPSTIRSTTVTVGCGFLVTVTTVVSGLDSVSSAELSFVSFLSSAACAVTVAVTVAGAGAPRVVCPGGELAASADSHCTSNGHDETWQKLKRFHVLIPALLGR